MRRIKRLIVTIVVAMLVLSCIIPTTAGTLAYGNLKFIEDKGLVVAFNDNVPENEITAVKFGDTTLTKGTDYTIDATGNTVITFSEDFMEDTLVDDVKSIAVYNGTEKYKIGTSTFDTIFANGEYFYQASTSDYFYGTGNYHDTGLTDEALLDIFIEKGILTKATREDGTIVYKHGNLEVFYVDDEYAYSAEVNFFENMYYIDITFAESYELFMMGDEYYGDSSLVAAFGNLLVIDWSDLEVGVETEIIADDFTKMEMFLDIQGICYENNLILDYEFLEENGYAIVRDAADTKDMFKVRVEEVLEPYSFNLYITILADDLTYEDNLYFKVPDSLMAGQRGCDYNLFTLVFKNPPIKNGDNSSWNTEDEGGLAISSYAEYDDYICMYVDGGQIPADAYTVTEGSTVITFTEEYLKSLDLGNHTLEIVSTIGSATATFSTVAGETNVVETNDKADKAITEESKETEEIANTADNAPTIFFSTIAMLSAAGFVTIKKNNK